MPNSCNRCGVCCQLFMINLSKQEYESGAYQTIFQEYGLIENFNKAKDCGANFLAKKEDGSCIYLVNKLCSVHSNRPKVCQKFFCTSKAKKFQGMISLINKKKC